MESICAFSEKLQNVIQYSPYKKSHKFFKNLVSEKSFIMIWHTSFYQLLRIINSNFLFAVTGRKFGVTFLFNYSSFKILMWIISFLILSARKQFLIYHLCITFRETMNPSKVTGEIVDVQWEFGVGGCLWVFWDFQWPLLRASQKKDNESCFLGLAFHFVSYWYKMYLIE